MDNSQSIHFIHIIHYYPLSRDSFWSLPAAPLPQMDWRAPRQTDPIDGPMEVVAIEKARGAQEINYG